MTSNLTRSKGHFHLFDVYSPIEEIQMDRDKAKSNGNGAQDKNACPSCELSQEDKELCREIGRLLARIGDRLNSQMQLTRNGHNLRLNCREGERLSDDDTRPRTGVNKLP